MIEPQSPLNFTYSDAEGEAIISCLSDRTDHKAAIGFLEEHANHYRRVCALLKTRYGETLIKDAAVLASGLNQVVAGLAGIKAAGSLAMLQVEMKELAQFISTLKVLQEHANYISRIDPLPSFAPKRKGEKALRRALIEQAYIFWQTVESDPTDAKRMLDFISVAVTPVLVLDDKFNSDPFAARDALGKVIDQIKVEGLKYPWALAGLSPKEKKSIF